MADAARHSIEDLLQRALHSEAEFGPYRPENQEVELFRTTWWGCTELEYLYLLSALVGVFKPAAVLETGTLGGDGTIALMHGAGPNAHVITCGDSPINDCDSERLRNVANLLGCRLSQIAAHTRELMAEHDGRLRQLCKGQVTFAYLDSSIPDRPQELAFIGNCAHGIMNLSRPCCVCVHDMSSLRHPNDMHSDFQPCAVDAIAAWANQNGWQQLRLHQSRGMLVLCKYPFS